MRFLPEDRVLFLLVDRCFTSVRSLTVSNYYHRRIQQCVPVWKKSMRRIEEYLSICDCKKSIQNPPYRFIRIINRTSFVQWKFMNRAEESLRKRRRSLTVPTIFLLLVLIGRVR